MLPLSDRQVLEVLLAALAVAIGLVGEVYDRLEDDDTESVVDANGPDADEYQTVARVNADVVVLEAPDEREAEA